MMDKRQVTAAQRSLFRQAFGMMEAALELSGTEDGAVASDGMDQFRALSDKVDEFREWIFGSSPIA